MTFKLEGLPASVRVGPHDIRFNKLSPEEAAVYNGTYYEYGIQLASEFPSGSVAVEIVLHELLHAIFKIGGVTPKAGEEHVVSCIASFLAQIARDNPEFVRWVQDTVDQ